MMNTLSVTSGKGGVGKSTLSANLGLALSQMGYRVVLFDADFGMSNLEIMFGVRPTRTVFDLVDGSSSVFDVLTPVSNDLHLLSGGIAIETLNKLSAHQRRTLLDRLMDLERVCDFLIFDTGPGLNENVFFSCQSADERLVIINPEPTSLSDSYSLIKVLSESYKTKSFSILVNQVGTRAEGERLFLRFMDVTDQFLDVRLELAAVISTESLVKHSLILRRPVLSQFPKSHFATEVRALAESLHVRFMQRLPEAQPSVNPFWQSLVQVGA